MTAKSESPSHAGAVAGVGAALLWQGDAGARTYAVFEVVCTRPGGLFLGGPFFLEVEEEATIEFRLTDGAVRARARVIEVIRGEQPGMVVALVDPDEAICARITAAAGAAG